MILTGSSESRLAFLGTVLVIYNFVLHAWQADWAAFAGPWQRRLAVEWTFLDSESDHRKGDRQTWSNFKTDGLKKHEEASLRRWSLQFHQFSLIYRLKLECVHRRSHLNGYSVLIQADFSAGCQDRLAIWLMDCFRRTCEHFFSRQWEQDFSRVSRSTSVGRLQQLLQIISFGLMMPIEIISSTNQPVLAWGDWMHNIT